MNTMFHEEMVRQHIADLHEAANTAHLAKISRRRQSARVRYTWRQVVGARLVDMGLSLMDECRSATLQVSK